MYTFLLSSFTVFIYFSQHTHDTTQCESGFKSRFTVNIKEKLPKPPRHYPLGGGGMPQAPSNKQSLSKRWSIYSFFLSVTLQCSFFTFVLNWLNLKRKMKKIFKSNLFFFFTDLDFQYLLKVFVLEKKK